MKVLVDTDVLLDVARAVGGPLAGFAAPSFDEHLTARWRDLGAQRGRQDFRVFWTESLANGGLFDDAGPADQFLLAPGASAGHYRRVKQRSAAHWRHWQTRGKLPCHPPYYDEPRSSPPSARPASRAT